MNADLSLLTGFPSALSALLHLWLLWLLAHPWALAPLLALWAVLTVRPFGTDEDSPILTERDRLTARQ